MKYEDAERLYKLAVADAEMFGADPRLGSSLCNLAKLYHIMGRNEEAEALFIRSLEIMEQTLGGKHPVLGITTHEFAAFLLSSGKLNEARPVYERALRIKGGSIGESHREYGTTLYHLAEVLRRQGNVQAAVPLLQKALAVAEDGSGFPTKQVQAMTSVKWRNRLAESMAEVGQEEAALELQRVAVSQVQPSEHAVNQCAIGVRQGLAEALWRVGKRDEAEAISYKDLELLKAHAPPAVYAGRLRSLAAIRIACDASQASALAQAVKELEECVEVTAEDPTRGGQLELVRSLMALGDAKGLVEPSSGHAAYTRAQGLACELKQYQEMRTCEAKLNQ